MRELARRMVREGHANPPRRENGKPIVAWWRPRWFREAVKVEQAKRRKRA